MIDFTALLTQVAGRPIEPALGDDFRITLPRYGITTDFDVAHFVAQVAEETGGFRAYVENLNYSAEGLMRTWPSRFDAATAAAYAHRPEAIANLVYANRMGNGPPASGDGWRFRGRGDLETTGRYAYAEAAEATGLDLINHPELLEGFGGGSLEAACAFWKLHGCSVLANADNLVGVTRAVNGGLINFAHRKAYLAKAKAAIAEQRVLPVTAQPVDVAPAPAPSAVNDAAHAPAPSPAIDAPPAPAADATSAFDIPPIARSLWSAYGHRGLAFLDGLAAAAAAFYRDHKDLVILFGGFALLIFLAVILLAWIKEHDRHADLERARAAPAPDAPAPALPGLSDADVGRIAAAVAGVRSAS